MIHSLELNRFNLKYLIIPKRSRNNQSVLDLHHLEPNLGESVEEAVARVMDNFMSRYLLQKTVDISIIVGKGLRSTRFINGKNPLRHYVENYLTRVGCSWTNGDWTTGQEGVIRVRW
jgi:hypothetical protein